MPSLMEIDESKKNTSDPTFTMNFSDYGKIVAVHLSKYEWSQRVLLLSFAKKVIVAHVNIEDELEFEKLVEINHELQFNILALSPETNTSFLPTTIQFCSAADDCRLRVFKGDLTDNYSCKVLVGHSSYINDINYDPENNYIASVSDDKTVKLWSTIDYQCIATLYLSSPGVSACWQKDDKSKLLVAEKNGIVRFYNVENQKPILSINCNKPLASVHWAPSDAQLIATLQMGELLIWDLTRPSTPSAGNLIYTEAGGELKFSPMSDLIGLVNRLAGTLKVVRMQNQQLKVCAKVNIPTNISWHFRLPYICLGDDTKLCFWKIISK